MVLCSDHDFMKTMANALVDFNELTCHAPLQFLLEVIRNIRCEFDLFMLGTNEYLVILCLARSDT